MLLQNKNAIIYGAGGSLGGAISRALSAAGAKVFLTGRTPAPLEKIKTEILFAGGKAETAVVNALDATEIDDHVRQVAEKGGTIDIVFNAIGMEAVQNIPLIDMSLADFVRPISIAMQTQFLTSAAAGKIMKRQRSGVILSLTATPGGVGYPFVGGFGPACCAMESFSRNLAAELGPYGVRVVNIRSGGSPDSKVFMEAKAAQPEEMETVLAKMKNDTMLKKLPLMADIASTAVFLVSSHAAMITGVTIDVTAGTTTGLNYKVEPIPLK